jgi:putative flippase GtrA
MTREARGQWFATAMAAIARRLPFGLSGVVPPNVVGYLLISGCTFCLDLGFLTIFHGALGIIPAVAVTMSYSIACLVNYTVNRFLNFRSHGSLGTQLPVSVAIFIMNYLAFVLGVYEGLIALGVEYQLARLLAACCEGVFLYCCMRWLVFRDGMGSTPVGPNNAAVVADRAPANAAPAMTASAPSAEAPRPVVPAETEGG